MPRGVSFKMLTIVTGCGCTKTYPGKVRCGDKVLCRKHGPTYITMIDPENWQVRCQVCRYSSKNLGAAPITAETRAVKHALKYGHRVRAWTESGNEFITDPDVRQLALCEPPPL